MYRNYPGIWANKDVELLISEEIILKFVRNDQLIIASLFKKISHNKNGYFQPKAVAIFDGETKRVGMKYDDHISKKEKQIGADLSDSISLDVLDSISLNELVESLTKIETISKNQPEEFPKAAENSIGDCLREWNLGVSFYKSENDSSFTASIRTSDHSYIFSYKASLDKPMIYCRAARIKSNNNGSAFSQNIRLMKNERGFTAFMAEDNLQMAGSELIIDDSRFKHNECSIDLDGTRYWSLKEFTADRIVLNGCGGDEYVYNRPSDKVKI